MKDFNVRPFNYLPLNNGDLFDLTCESAISLLEKIDTTIDELTKRTISINSLVPKADFLSFKNCFWLVDQLLDDYSKLIKCVNISLGEKGYQVQSPTQIFNRFSYSPNKDLQDLVTGGLRNTAQHFEERLQVYHSQMDPLLKLSYKGQHIQWEIKFGNGGYRIGGSADRKQEVFDFGNLYFHSYKKDKGVLANEEIRLSDVVKDIAEMQQLIDDNMEDYISKNSICCPPIRSLGVFVMPHVDNP